MLRAPMTEIPAPVLTAALLLLAAGIQGFIGFGFGIVAMVGLTLSRDLVHAAGVVNLTALLLTATILATLRRHVLWRSAARILPGILVGVLLGVTALRALDRELLVRTLGACVIAFSAWNLWSPRVWTRETPVWDGVAGLVSGMLGGAFSAGGPPLVAHLYRRPEPPDAIKGTLQALFLATALTRVPVAASQGLMAGPVWTEAALGAPFVLAGLFSGIALGRRVAAQRLRRIAWVGLGLLGGVLLLAPRG